MLIARLTAGALFMIGALSAFIALKAPVRVEKNALVGRGDQMYYQGHLFSGWATEHYSTGDLFRETHFVDGRPEGVSREFAQAGNLRALWNYHRGVKEGRQLGWFIEGPRRFESNFKNGVLDGVQTEWHLNGTVFRRQKFEDGVETEKKILYPGAEIFTNYARREGRTYGIDGGALCMEVKREGAR